MSQPVLTSVQIGRRISVIGATGSGKTHLSRILAGILGLRVCSLDELREDRSTLFQDDDAFTRSVHTFASGQAWVIDGHYRSVRHIIWQQADTAIFLNLPLSVILFQLAGRLFDKTFKRQGKHAEAERQRNDGADDHAGKAASWSRRWKRLLKTVRERREYVIALNSPECAHLTIIELKSRKAMGDFLRSIAPDHSHVDRPGSGAGNFAPFSDLPKASVPETNNANSAGPRNHGANA